MKSINKIYTGAVGIILMTLLCMFTGATVQAQKFAYVDTEYILGNIPEYKIAQTQIDDLSSKWQKDIETQFAEIDKMYKTYEADATMLPEEMKRKRENEIINKEKGVKDLQKQRFGQNGDLFKKRQELIKPIQDRVYNAIEAVSTQDNIAIVFDKASGATMIYTNSKYDISDAVIKRLGNINGNQQPVPVLNQPNKPAPAVNQQNKPVSR